MPIFVCLERLAMTKQPVVIQSRVQMGKLYLAAYRVAPAALIVAAVWAVVHDYVVPDQIDLVSILNACLAVYMACSVLLLIHYLQHVAATEQLPLGRFVRYAFGTAFVVIVPIYNYSCVRHDQRTATTEQAP